MNEEERNWEKNKRGLIITVMRVNFEERVGAFLNSDSWSTVEELDNWIDANLRQYEETKKAIIEYYDEKIYS